jgi:F0F1-type ATP synthase assembly protein I
MSGLDKELEAAYAAQQERKKGLEQSKAELAAVSAQGDQLASRSKVIAIVGISLGTVIGSGILLADPDSRPWGFMLLFCVLVMGAFSWYKNWRKT